jgi:4-hydroxy-2-oxoheptanedioate aldolase
MLKDALNKGSFVLGTWCDIPSPEVVNVLAKAKLDFIIIDMEHGPMDFKTAQEMDMAARSEGMETLIRVPRIDSSDILRALDTGVSGIIVPHIENIEDRKRVVSYSKFPPVGERGFNPYIRCGGYHQVGPDYFNERNNNTLVALILEGIGALNNLEAIIDDPEIDLIYIGTYDLSVALGLSGNAQHPKVLKELEKAVGKIRKARKSAGCMIHDVSDLNQFKEFGIQFITYQVDSAIIYESFSRMRREFDR